MKTNSKKRSPTVGEFFACIYDVYFPHDRDYHGGTDADHPPVIPGNDFPPDAGQIDEFPLQSTEPDNADMTSGHGLRPES